MAVIRKGKAWPIKGSRRITYDPRNGYSTQDVFRGTLREAEAYCAALTAANVGWTLDIENGNATVTQINNASDPAGNTGEGVEVPVDSWQILGNEIQKSLWDHHMLHYANQNFWRLNTGSERNFVDILKYNTQQIGVKDYPPIEVTGLQQWELVASALWSGTFNGVAVGIDFQSVYTAFFELLSKDQDHYALAQYVLRHTQTISDQYTQNITDANPGSVYTTDQLIDECTAGDLVYPLPGRMVAKLEAIPSLFAFQFPLNGYLWGWRKLPSTETTVANRKIEITTDYCLDMWNTNLYPAL